MHIAEKAFVVFVTCSVFFALYSGWTFSRYPEGFSTRHRFWKKGHEFLEFVGIFAIGFAVVKLMLAAVPPRFLLDDEGHSERLILELFGGLVLAIMADLGAKRIVSKVCALESALEDVQRCVTTLASDSVEAPKHLVDKALVELRGGYSFEVGLVISEVRTALHNMSATATPTATSLRPLGAYGSGNLHQFCGSCGWWKAGHNTVVETCEKCGAELDPHVALEFGGLTIESDGTEFRLTQEECSVRIEGADCPDVLFFMRDHAPSQRYIPPVGNRRTSSGKGNYCEMNQRMKRTRLFTAYLDERTSHEWRLESQ